MPPKAAIWGHSPRTKIISEMVLHKDSFTDLLLFKKLYKSYSIRIGAIDCTIWPFNDLKLRIEKIGIVMDESRVPNGFCYLEASLSDVEFEMIVNQIQSFGKLPKTDVFELSLTKYNCGLLTLNQIDPLPGYALLPGIRDINQLRSSMTFSISNFPYVTTHLTIPYAPDHETFLALWNRINNIGYIKLNQKHLKFKSFNGKIWKYDSGYRKLNMDVLEKL